jgi:hypothetical protein
MNSHFLANDAASTKAQIETIKAQYPELGEDTDLLRDMAEGETAIMDIISKAVDISIEADMMIDALKGRKEQIEFRQKRYERQKEGAKAIIHSLLDAIGQAKVMLPQATISVTAARDKTVVTNVDELTQGFFRTERKPLVEEITKALKAGVAVPGAVLEKGKSGLMIRTK